MRKKDMTRAVQILSVGLIVCWFASSCSPLVLERHQNSIKTIVEDTITAISEQSKAPPISETQMPVKTLVKETTIVTKTPEKTLVSLTATATIASTPLFDNTSTPTKMDSSLNSQYIVINDRNQMFFLVDSVTGNYRILQSDSIHPSRFISFLNNGCGLVVRLDNQSIVQIDLKAIVIREMLPSAWYQGSGVVVKEFLSPSGESLAYIVGRGYQGYDYFEKEDVEIIHLTDRNVFKITEHGGAYEAAWSPNGSWIAFSDYDDSNFIQIYLADKIGMEKKKLTSFDEKVDPVRLLRWSPDGTKIAYNVIKKDDGSHSFGVIYIEEEKGIVKTFLEVPPRIRNLWWEDDNILVIHTNYERDEEARGEEVLIWLDSRTGKILDSLRESDTPGHIIASSFPYNQTSIGFLSDESFFTYDKMAKVFIEHFPITLPRRWWSLSPLEFPGELNCRNP